MRNFLISTLSLLTVTTIGGVSEKDYNITPYKKIIVNKIEIEQYQKNTKLYQDVEALNMLFDEVDRELRSQRDNK